MQPPHRKHAGGDRWRGRLLGGFRRRLSHKGRWPARTVFFKVGKHKVVFGQQPVALAESDGRRILRGKLAFGRSGSVTLRCRYMIAHRSPVDFKWRELARGIGDGSRRAVDKCLKAKGAATSTARALNLGFEPDAFSGGTRCVA